MKNVLRAVIDGYTPLKIRNFRIYLSGQAVSLLGTWMQSTAQAWVVWELTKSELSLGIVFMLGFLPFIVLGPWTGVWADRLNRRRVLIATQFSAMSLAIVFAVLVQTSQIRLWHIYILTTLLGIVNAFDLPSQQAFLSDLSGNRNVRKAIVLNSAIIQISRMLGPALAGWVIAAIGVAPAFWLNGLSFLAVILSLLAISSNQERVASTSNPLAEFKEGLKFLRSNSRLVDLMILTLIMTFFAFTSLQIMPAIATEVLNGNAATLGLLLGASGAGALIGSMILAPLTYKIRRVGLLISLSVIWSGFWFFIFSFSTNLNFSLICLFLAGLVGPLIYATTNGLLQLNAPNHMKGRILSVLLMITFGIQPISSFIVGYIAELFNSQLAIRVNGVMMIAGALILILIRPELKQWKVNIAVE